MSYPWIKDSQYLIPSVTGYLAVTSPNGLYMVDPNNSSNYTSFGIDSLNLNGTSHTWSSIVAGGPIPSLAQVLTTGGNSAGSSSINMNNNNVTGINSAITTNDNLLAPQKVDMLTANSVVPSTNLDSNMRYIACNSTASAAWTDSGIVVFPPGGSIENVTAFVYSFGAYNLWVGTENGNLYRSNDGGASWEFHYQFGGRINCLCTYRGNSRMAVGGLFSGNGFTNLAGLDNIGYNLIDITNGYGGLNNEVKCFYDNLNNACLYIGGSFTDYNGNPGNITNAFFTYDYQSNIWYTFDNLSGGGFLKNGSVGTVNAICKGDNNYIMVGGDFTEVISSFGSLTIEYLCPFETTNGFNVVNFFPYVGPNVFNARVLALLLEPNFNGVLVGGEFTSFGPGPSLYSYGTRIVFNNSPSNWDVYPYPFASSPGWYISSITQPAINSGITDVYTIYGGRYIYKNSTLLPDRPVGSDWSCIAWNGTDILYATNDQSAPDFNFYKLENTTTAINLTSVYPITQYSTISYNNIKLLASGSCVELMWNFAKSQWYILSYQGASFSYGALPP
jgi:hypothetical protein